MERRYDTMLNLISQIGGIYKGLTIFGLIFLYHWQRYNHDQQLATSLLLERESKENKQGNPERSLHAKALKRFSDRTKFSYPTFYESLACCKSHQPAKRRIKFAKNELKKEMDIARFINQQRETYI